ncbi:MAG: type II toxin-antitoxin system HicA family toxin [Pseudonocardia sp.]
MNVRHRVASGKNLGLCSASDNASRDKRLSTSSARWRSTASTERDNRNPFAAVTDAYGTVTRSEQPIAVRSDAVCRSASALTPRHISYGSHCQFRHAAKPGTTTIAGKPSDTLPPATEKSILRQAGIERRRR